MRTLVIFGSPKRNGHTMALVQELAAGLNDSETEIIHVSDCPAMRPCMDCGRCRTARTCMQDDAFNELQQKIEAADCIVLAAPMWFGTISGTLLSFLSRLRALESQYRYQGRVHQYDKAGVLLLTTGAAWQGMGITAENTAEPLFRLMDALMIDFVQANSTDRLPAAENAAALQRCRAAADKVNLWYEQRERGAFCQTGRMSSDVLASR